MANLQVEVAGVSFKNPVLLASGCCGFGEEYDVLYPMEKLGGICLKGTTPELRMGNPPPRIAETPAGMLNSVGLQNPGMDALMERLPGLLGRDTVIIPNLAGEDLDGYRRIVERICQADVPMIELNISCPNVRPGGENFGLSCEGTAKIVRAVRSVCNKPLMVKLTPNVTDIVSIAKAAETEGADAISLINTLLGMRIDLATRRPILHNNIGGLSGPAIFPVALRMVWQVASQVKIPVVGLGGIRTGRDALEMMMAGATAVQVGAALFQDAYTPLHILDEMNEWLDQQGIQDVREIIGAVRPY